MEENRIITQKEFEEMLKLAGAKLVYEDVEDERRYKLDTLLIDTFPIGIDVYNSTEGFVVFLHAIKYSEFLITRVDGKGNPRAVFARGKVNFGVN